MKNQELKIYYVVSISHEGGFFFADENNESCDGSQDHAIVNFDTAMHVYNNNNHGEIELRKYENDEDGYVILKSKSKA